MNVDVILFGLGIFLAPWVVLLSLPDCDPTLG